MSDASLAETAAEIPLSTLADPVEAGGGPSPASLKEAVAAGLIKPDFFLARSALLTPEQSKTFDEGKEGIAAAISETLRGQFSFSSLEVVGNVNINEGAQPVLTFQVCGDVPVGTEKSAISDALDTALKAHPLTATVQDWSRSDSMAEFAAPHNAPPSPEAKPDNGVASPVGVVPVIDLDYTLTPTETRHGTLGGVTITIATRTSACHVNEAARQTLDAKADALRAALFGYKDEQRGIIKEINDTAHRIDDEGGSLYERTFHFCLHKPGPESAQKVSEILDRLELPGTIAGNARAGIAERYVAPEKAMAASNAR